MLMDLENWNLKWRISRLTPNSPLPIQPELSFGVVNCLVVFSTHFNPNNSFLILLQISLLFMFTPALRRTLRRRIVCQWQWVTIVNWDPMFFVNVKLIMLIFDDFLFRIWIKLLSRISNMAGFPSSQDGSRLSTILNVSFSWSSYSPPFKVSLICLHPTRGGGYSLIWAI